MSVRGDHTQPGNHSWRNRCFSYIVVFLALIYVFAILWVFPKWTVDDAYITYRYAENLALHGQFAWNVGEVPVEGYTGVLLPVSLASGILIGIPPDLTSKVIGVLAFLLGATALFRIGKQQGVAPWVICALLLLYLTLPLNFTHALGGLETMLFGPLLLGAVCQLLNVIDDSVYSLGRDIMLLLLLLLVSLARPEGMAFAVVVICVLTVTKLIRSRRVPWRLVACTAFFYVLPMVVYMIWRWWYYGSLLPNTYYAKLALSSDAPTITSNLSDFWHGYLALPTAAGGLYILGRITATRTDTKRGPSGTAAMIATVTAIVFFMALVFYQYSRTTPMMDFSFRFFVPFYPLLLVLISILADWGAGWRMVTARHFRWLSIIMTFLSVVMIGSQVFRNVKYLPKEIDTAQRYLNLIRDEHIRAGLFLKESVPDSEWTVVHIDAGAIPYFSRLKTVDFGRLNDRFLTRQSLTLEQEVDYFYSRKPAALVFTSQVPDSVVHGPQAAAIIADRRFKEYGLAACFGSDAVEKYYELVFLRNDLLHSELQMPHSTPAIPD